MSDHSAHSTSHDSSAHSAKVSDEPQSPMWLPVLGAVMFLLAALYCFSGSTASGSKADGVNNQAAGDLQDKK